MSPRRLLLAAAVVCLTAASCAAREQKQSDGAGEQVVIFVSADLRGYLAPCGCSENMRGGIYRAAHQVAQARQQGPPVLYLDAGDSLFTRATLGESQIPQERRKAEAMSQAFAAIGLSAGAVGERDLALGEQFVLGLGLPHLRKGEARSFGPKQRRVGVAAGDDAASLRKAAAAARAQGARFVVALFTGTVPQALALLRDHPPAVDLVVASAAQDELDGEESRLLRGPIPVARVQSKGRSLLRVEVGFGPAPGRFELLTTDAEVAGEASALSERIALLDRQVNQPGIPPESKRLRQEKLQELVGRREALLAAPLPRIEAKNALSVRFLPLEAVLPTDPAVKALVERYDLEVGQINLAWAKAHGEDCPPPPARQAAFVGNAACHDCHEEAFAVWEASGHAHGYRTLEEVGKQHHLDCVGCHLTGWQRPGGVCRVDRVEGREAVGCESCHGPGSLHLEAPSAKNISLGNTEQACVGCHDLENSPHFDFATYLPRVRGPGHGEGLTAK